MVRSRVDLRNVLCAAHWFAQSRDYTGARVNVDKVFLATTRQQVSAYRHWAAQLGCGLELYAFSDPEILAGDWRAILREHQELLAGFGGGVGLHGAFYDMVSGSLDPDIVAITRKRYLQNLYIAAELGAHSVVFHLNYMGMLGFPNYRPGWHKRQVAFWGALGERAAKQDVRILMENLWEDDPGIMTDVLAEIDNPYVCACLDVAHATLYSQTPLATWVEHLSPWLYSCHLNNHDGRLDWHWSLDKGVINYQHVLTLLRQLPQAPLLVLEMSRPEQISASLPLLRLSVNHHAPQNR